MDIQQEIYAQLESMSEPARLPAPWSRFPAPPNFRAPLRDFRAVVRQLRQKFTVAQLLSAGVFVRWAPPAEPQSEIATSTASTQTASQVGINLHLVVGPWLLLREGAKQPPFAIVTSAGCLDRSQLPVLAALKDFNIQNFQEHPLVGDTLFATFSVIDAAVLQFVNLPAVTAHGLETLRGEHLQQFRHAFDVRNVGPQWMYDDDEDEEDDSDEFPDEVQDKVLEAANQVHEPELGPTQTGDKSQPAPSPSPAPFPAPPPSDDFGDWTTSLCLVAFDPARLSLDDPPKRAEIGSHLLNLSTNLDLLFDQVGVWDPEPELLTKLASVLEFGTRQDIRRLLMKGWRDSTSLLLQQEPDPAATENSHSIGKTFATLRDFVDAGEDSTYLRKDFHRQLQEECIGPLFDLAKTQKCPLKKSRMYAQAMALGPQMRLMARLALSAKARAQNCAELRPGEIEAAEMLRRSLQEIIKLTSPKES